MKNFSLKTKRNSLQNSGRTSILKASAYTAIAILIVFLLRGVIGYTTSGLGTSIQVVRSYFAQSGAVLPSYIRDRNELLRTIESLREELAARSGDMATIQRLSHENEELRRQFAEVKEERIRAGVIARPPSVPYDMLVLDRGSMHGILEGALVYHEGNHGIGIVSQVYPESSLVTLFSTPGSEITVYIYGPNVFAYAYGEGGGVMRISVPQGVALNEGDPVVLPSLDSGDVGVIERIVSLPAQPEQNAYVAFPVSLQSIRSVSVGKSPLMPRSYEDIAPNLEAINARFNIPVPDHARSVGSTSTPTTTPADESVIEP